MIILAHGGAGAKKPAKRALNKIKEALGEGFGRLKKGASALEAALMEGRDLLTGSVVGLEGFKNPVLAARLAMDLPHRVLTHDGARRVALANRLTALPGPDKKALDRLEKIKSGGGKFLRLYERYFSTIGAVALDGNGDIASGSSTGGVACTGKGEDIIRLALAKEVAMKMKWSGASGAVKPSLKRILSIGGQAGVIALDKKGSFTVMHTTMHMAAGYADGKEAVAGEAFKRVR